MEESTSSAAAAPSEATLLVSKTTIREIEQNSRTIYALAKASKGPLIARVAMIANEMLRGICESNVEKETINQLDFYVRDQRLQEEGAETMLCLAKSIRAMAVDIGKIEETEEQLPLKIKPPLNFGDDSDGMENMRVSSMSPFKQRKRTRRHNLHALFRHTDDSDEEEYGDGYDGKPATAKNDFTVRLGPTLKFRPLTPDHLRAEEAEYDPSPPPSPIVRNPKKTTRRKKSNDIPSDDEFSDMEDDHAYLVPTAKSSPAPKESMCCAMCDMVFFEDHQLHHHLVSYHRLKLPSTSNINGDDDEVQMSLSAADDVTPLHHTVTRTPAIVTSKPINGTAHSNGTMRYTPTTVVSPGGTVRTYSNASNAARAAAKAAAAAANGIFRPNVPARPYTCRHCGVVLQSQQMYASHVRYAHPKDKPPGETTNPTARKSSGTSSAIVHLQMDDGTKTFQCRRCEKTFDSAQKVAGHSRHCLLVFEGKARPANQGPVPTEDRPYTVYRCGLASELARTCPYCGMLTSSIRKVDKHVRMAHDASRHEVYGCTTCDRRFVTLGGIENHWLHYGDCPNGVLTVHQGDAVTCADIGPMPPSLKKPKLTPRKPTADDADISEQIANAILGQYGYRVQKQEAPDLSAETNGNSASGEDDEEEAPELEEMNGSAPMDEGKETVAKREPTKRPIVSMKVITCRKCNFAARTRESMDVHMAKEHPDVAGTSTASEDDEMNGGSSSHRNGASSGSKNKQSGVVRRILSPR